MPASRSLSHRSRGPGPETGRAVLAQAPQRACSDRSSKDLRGNARKSVPHRDPDFPTRVLGGDQARGWLYTTGTGLGAGAGVVSSPDTDSASTAEVDRTSTGPVLAAD